MQNVDQRKKMNEKDNNDQISIFIVDQQNITTKNEIIRNSLVRLYTLLFHITETKKRQGLFC